MSKVQPIPEDRRGVIAQLTIDGAKKAIEFYKKAFDAEASECMDGPAGKVGHAELKIGAGVIMINDAFPEWNCLPTKNARMFFYVADVDAAVQKAVKAGCKLERPVEDQFWGDRMGNVVDPFGVGWGIATHKEDLTSEQVKARGKEWMEKMSKQPAGAK